MKNEHSEFYYACKEFLNSFRIIKLRPVGRWVGISNAAALQKGELIEKTVAILEERLAPDPKTTRGAPPKNNSVDRVIMDGIDTLKRKYLSSQDPTRMQPFHTEFPGHDDSILVASSDESNPFANCKPQEMYVGQLVTRDGASYLHPVDGREATERVFVPVSLIRLNDLREGDHVTCKAQRQKGVLIAARVLAVNGIDVQTLVRQRFESLTPVPPKEKISFLSSLVRANVTAKFLQWFVPIGKGQRTLVYGPSKSGKSQLLLEAAKRAVACNSNLTVCAVLIEQPPEIIREYRTLQSKNTVLFTSYEDEADRHVFSADFLLNRAKRLAESGADVLLVVDSLTALARAYDETDSSAGGKVLSCGLESKTVRYIKSFFATGRALENSGSLTILASADIASGNPADDYLFSQLVGVANSKIALDGSWAAKRVFPAISLAGSSTDGASQLLTDEEEAADRYVRKQFLDQNSYLQFIELLQKESSPQNLSKNS